MSSEKLGSAKELLKGNLGGSWDLLEGCEGNYTELGIARNFGDSSVAAYSLRDIGSMNGPVVRVRREPEDTTAAINDEEKFSANQVQSGALEDWVNGKLESTLPADVATAAGAYSLRKVKASYSGNAVRIRRSSDSVEVDVAFDSNDKVSASSSITNVAEQGGESGQTTATTLGGFINHSEDFGNFRVDNEWSDNLLAFSYVGKTSFSVEAKSLSGFNSTDTVRVTAPITNVIAEPQASITKFKTTFTIDSISGEGNGNLTDGALYVKGANSPNGNGSWNLHNSPDGTGGDETFKFTSAGTYTVEGYGEDATDAYNLAFRTFSFIIYSGTKVSVSNVSMEVLNDCGVHTWYDQAGSDNAVQTTADNQPKIAENGALLADGISFDGTNDFLNTDGVFTDNREASIFIKVKALTSDATGSDWFYTEGYSGENGSVAQTIGVGITDTGNIADITASTDINANDGRASALANGGVISLIGGSSTTASYANGVQMGSITTPTNAGGNYTITTSGGIGGHSSTSSLATFSIEELLLYTSDQSDNRLKIESNINNHYGLYNDEYEWDDATNTEWQNHVTNGTTTFTANGKDGFTITATGENVSNFKYAITSPSTASNNYYKVSFNVNDPDGLFENAQLRLTATGSGATAQTITNGFNSMSLRTGSSFEYMAINSDGGGSSKTATISDFKISRIARNGFVETWYDQSSSGNNATQTTASQQPKIVENGGIVKNVKGFPSLKFESSKSTELDIGLLISNLNSVSAYVVTQKDSGDTNRIAGFTQGVSSNNSRFYFPFYSGGTTPNLGYNNSASKISFGTTLTRTCNLYSAFSGDTNIEAFKNGTSVGTTALVDQAVTATDSKIGQLSNSFRFDGVMSEIFLTNQKLQDDADMINDNVTSYYNL